MLLGLFHHRAPIKVVDLVHGHGACEESLVSIILVALAATFLTQKCYDGSVAWFGLPHEVHCGAIFVILDGVTNLFFDS